VNREGSKIKSFLISCEASKDSWNKRKKDDSGKKSTIYDDAFIVRGNGDISAMIAINIYSVKL
jgi:hypothetical protein